jgi:hypothetical protein
MYNYDVLGSRYNRGENAISRDNAGRLEEKWRFPAKGSGQEIGAIHATPVVVDGYVYFGTASVTPTFYKLTPDGKVRWSYRNRRHGRCAQGDRPRGGVVGPLGFPRPGLRRHGQHAVLTPAEGDRRPVLLRAARRG